MFCMRGAPLLWVAAGGDVSLAKTGQAARLKRGSSIQTCSGGGGDGCRSSAPSTACRIRSNHQFARLRRRCRRFTDGHTRPFPRPNSICSIIILLSFLCPDPYTGGRTFAVQGKIFSGYVPKRRAVRGPEAREDFNHFIRKRPGMLLIRTATYANTELPPTVSTPFRIMGDAAFCASWPWSQTMTMKQSCAGPLSPIANRFSGCRRRSSG